MSAALFSRTRTGAERGWLLASVVRGVAATAVLLMPRLASAAPSSNDVDGLFSHTLLALRGFSGVAPGFGTGFLNGGDVRFLVQGSRWGFGIGGRFGAAGSATFSGTPGAAERPNAAQLTLFDAGLRAFVSPREPSGLYLGTGFVGGPLWVDRFAFSYATLFAAYGELGLELPRTAVARLTGALRLEAGNAPRTEFSRIGASSGFFSATLQVGFVLGGDATGSLR